MKYFLVILTSLFILGCASSQNSSSANNYNSKKGIVDQEFDLLIAPEYDYESDVPYAEQIKVTTKSTAVSTTKTAKPSTKPTATKVN